MFILSQDKRTFFNADTTNFFRVMKDSEEGNVVDVVVAYLALRSDNNEWNTVLGRYETPERAQEVFAELCSDYTGGRKKMYEMPEM